jgi:hypothetical protein
MTRYVFIDDCRCLLNRFSFDAVTHRLYCFRRSKHASVESPVKPTADIGSPEFVRQILVLFRANDKTKKCFWASGAIFWATPTAAISINSDFNKGGLRSQTILVLPYLTLKSL